MLEIYGGLDILVNNAGIAFKVAATEPVAVQENTYINPEIMLDVKAKLSGRWRVLVSTQNFSITKDEKIGIY